MPLFNFKCNACGNVEEFMVSGNQKIDKRCASCDSSNWEKQFTKRMGVVFKGSGFYVSDNRASSSQKKTPLKKDKK